MSSTEDFVAESLSAERSGAFAQYFKETRPAARRLVRRLLSSSAEEARPRAMVMAKAKTAGRSPAREEGTLFQFLAHVAAPLLGHHGMVAGAASLAGAAGALGGAAVTPVAAVAAAAAALLGGEDGKGKDAAEARATSSGRQYVTLHFRSECQDDQKGRWTADVLIPTCGEGRAVVRLRVPRRGTGTFSFCGTMVPIANGRGEFPIEKFRAGLSRGGVAFARPGAAPVPGAPFLEVAVT